MEATLAFYGQGLARILQVVSESRPGRGNTYQHLINDKVVRGLLLIHDLHPDDLATRLRDALDQVRPYLESHGGNVELVNLTDQSAKLRLVGYLQKLRLVRGHLGAGYSAGHRRGMSRSRRL